MGRKQKKTCCGETTDRFNAIDMFGSTVNFNISGRTRYNSCLGSLTTILIFLVVACYGIHQMRQVFVATHVPIVNTQIREGYFEDTDVMRQDEGDFTFAVAVSSFTKYDEQSAEDFLQYGQFLMKYKITGGDQDGLEFPISMSPCSDEAMAAFGEHHVESKNAVIQSHIDAKQFFCPDAFDLTMWGEKTDAHSKILTVVIGPCDVSSFSEEEVEAGRGCRSSSDYYDGKQIALLVNSKRIDYGEDWTTPNVQQFTDMHWLPISRIVPQQATVTLVRNRFHDSESLLDTFIPFKPGDGYEDFISVPKDKIRTEPYLYPNQNEKVVAAIEFEVSDDLYVEVK